MSAVKVSQSVSVLFNEVVLLRATPVRIETRDDKIAGSTADGTRPIVVLCRALVIRSTPAANAFEAEDMIATLKQTDLLATFQDKLKADLALDVVSFIVIRYRFFIIVCSRVQIHALFSVFAMAL